MAGMCADTFPDDMKGLIESLNEIEQYKQIVFYYTDQFLMPPSDPSELFPLIKDKAIFPEILREALTDAGVTPLPSSLDELIALGSEHPEPFNQAILQTAARVAAGLYYEALLSFTSMRQIVAIVGEGNELSTVAVPRFELAVKSELDKQRVSKSDNLPLLGGVQDWPVIFDRHSEKVQLSECLPSYKGILPISDSIEVKLEHAYKRCFNSLSMECEVSYPAADDLNHPRALLLKPPSGSGFLLAMPRPSNMKNFSITLRTGKGIEVAKTESIGTSTESAPARVERNWMTRKETAKAIGKSPDTVDNYCRNGRLEFYKEGREVRISKESVQRYLGQ